MLAVVAEEGLIATEPPIDIPARTQSLRELIEAGAPAGSWVLEDDGRVVGAVAVEAHAAPGVLSLGMALLPEGRGRGGGRALLEAVVEHARACGAHKIDFEIWPTNARAIALYASAGFGGRGRASRSLPSARRLAALGADHGPAAR